MNTFTNVLFSNSVDEKNKMQRRLLVVRKKSIGIWINAHRPANGHIDDIIQELNSKCNIIYNYIGHNREVFPTIKLIDGLRRCPCHGVTDNVRQSQCTSRCATPVCRNFGNTNCGKVCRNPDVLFAREPTTLVRRIVWTSSMPFMDERSCAIEKILNRKATAV